MVSLIEFLSRENLAVRLASAIWSNLSVFHCEHLRGARRGGLANDLLCLKTKSLISKKSEEGALSRRAKLNLFFLKNRHANEAGGSCLVSMLIAHSCNKCYRVFYRLEFN